MTDRLASSLPAEALQAIEQLILEGRTLHALLLIREKAGRSLFVAQDLHWERRLTLKELHPVLRERDEEEARQATPEAWRAKALQARNCGHFWSPKQVRRGREWNLRQRSGRSRRRSG